MYRQREMALIIRAHRETGMLRLGILRRGVFAALSGLAFLAGAPGARGDDSLQPPGLPLQMRQIQSSAADLESSLVVASEAITFRSREDAINSIRNVRKMMSILSSKALDLAPFAGTERATAYATELLAISDALLGVRSLAEFQALQTRYRATYPQRPALFAEAEHSISLCGKINS